MTCLTNDNRPLSSMFPGSQNAFFNFFLTAAGLSSKSIFESSSDEDILPPAKPGTENHKKQFIFYVFDKSFVFFLQYRPIGFIK